MKTAFWDFGQGATEHMMLGALVAAGLDRERWTAVMASLPVRDWRLEMRGHDPSRRRSAVGIAGEGASLEPRAVRGWPRESLPPSVGAALDKTLDLLERLDPGATIPATAAVAMVGVHVGAHLLGLVRQWRTPLAVGASSLSAVTQRVLGEEVMIRNDRAVEVGPLGLVLARSIATVSSMPVTLRVETSGTGLAIADRPEGSMDGSSPHVTITIGTAMPEAERAFEVQATVDDMDPELIPPLLASLREGGALDAWWSPATTKGGRPGVTLHLLCHGERLDELSTRLLQESTTIGLRFHEVHRRLLPRTHRMVATEVGVIGVKETALPNGRIRWKAELGDCLRAARESGLTVDRVRLLVRNAMEADSRS